MSLGTFEIGEWRVDADGSRLLRDDPADGDGIRKLEPMATRVLLFLASRPGEVVSRAEILEQVWEGRAVVDETLSRAISLTRQALGDDASDPRYIETVPRRGYRLIAPVTVVAREPAHPDPAPPADDTAADGEVQPTSRRRWLTLATLVLLGVATFWVVRRGLDRPVEDGSARDPTARGRAPVSDSGSESGSDSAAAPEIVRAGEQPGIAVLPFLNLSPAETNDYLADGLTGELIHQLASVSGLRVVSQTSSMRFRETDALAPEIARVLGVDYLLEGTVQVVGGRIRITAQLIRPDRDEHLMSRSYDRDFSEVLDLQRAVATDVVAQTRTQLRPREASRLTRDGPVNAEAYRHYLQGRQRLRRRDDLLAARALLRHAVELDPDFAPAWASLADAYLLGISYLGMPEATAFADAANAIDQALASDPELASAHASRALLVFQRDRDWAGAEADYRNAINLEPSDVTARQWYSEMLSLLGRHEDALAQIEVAIALDPLSPLVHAAAGQRANAAGRYEEALRRFQDAEAVGGTFRWIHRERAWALYRLGDEASSLALLVENVRGRRRVGQKDIERLEQAVRERGRVGLYEEELRRLFARETRPPGFTTWVAGAYAGAGRVDEALEWLEKATHEPNLWLLHSFKDPAFDAVRHHPRIPEIFGNLPVWQPEGRGSVP